MGCPALAIIGNNLVFSVKTHIAATGALADADAVPAYRLYEDETGTPILTGDMAKLDDAGTLGLYSESIAATSGNGFENGKTYTIDIVATVSSVVGGISYSFTAYDDLPADMVKISGDAGAADNAELDYDGTGFDKANSEIGTVAVSTDMRGTDSAATEAKQDAQDAIITEARLAELDAGNLPTDIAAIPTTPMRGTDGANTVVPDAAGVAPTASEIEDAVWDAILTGASHNVPTSAGRRLRGIQEFQGYEDGAIWIDTVDGTAGTTDFENGTVENPVDTIADAVTLATSLNMKRFRIVSGSTITLAANSDNYTFDGDNWNLALGAQSIEESSFFGAHVTGIGTSTAGHIHLTRCLLGAVTLPPAVICDSGIGEDSGTFTGGSLGEYVFDNCYSLVPGAGAPAFVFTGLGASTGINNRGWKGGATYTLDADCTLSHEVFIGGGTTITTGGADVEVRGITRSLTVAMSAAETVQFVGITGTITLSGTTTATVNLFGVSSSVADSTSAATVTDSTTATKSEMDIAHALLSTVTALATHDGKLDTLTTNVDSIGIQQNQATSFTFLMVLTSDHVTPAPGLSITATVQLGAGAFGAIAGSVAEIGVGIYRVSLLAADTNSTDATLRLTAALADTRQISLQTHV